MGQTITIGLDIAKYIFQAHGADAAGHVVFRKRSREPSCLGFWRHKRPAWWRWRLAPGRTIGGGSSAVGPHGAADPAGLREAVREAAEERRGGR